MRALRIVFMGTPDFAANILQYMVEQGFTIVGVITAPDKPAGRGRKLQQSAVKTYAESVGLPVLQPTNLKSPDFQKELEALNGNLQVVVAFRMLPKTVWALPEYGTFNLHASLLPEYRGAAPIHWAIINGEKKSGVTTFFIDEKIDTGEIILQRSCEIGPDETVGELHDRLMHLGATLVLETIHEIAKGPVQTIAQPELEPKTAYKLFPDTCRVDWNAPLKSIYNKIRGLNPFPAAWTVLHNNEKEIQVKIYKVHTEIAIHEFEVGSVVSNKKELKIAVQGGYLVIDALKLSGKRLMETKQLLNGYEIASDAKVV